MSHHTEADRQKAKADRTITVARMFDAPPETLFRAFTEPELMSQWYAPEPITVARAEMDVRPGGRYTIVMRDQDGNDFTGVGEYKEVDPPKRLVYTDSVAEMPKGWVDALNEARGAAPGTNVPDGLVTVTFDDAGKGRTRVTFMSEYDSAATAGAYRQMQMVEGLEGGFDNLEKLVAKMPSMAR